MGLQCTPTAVEHRKVDKKFSILTFQGKSLPKSPRGRNMGQKCLFLAYRRLFFQNAALEVKMKQHQCNVPPFTSFELAKSRRNRKKSNLGRFSVRTKISDPKNGTFEAFLKESLPKWEIFQILQIFLIFQKKHV